MDEEIESQKIWVTCWKSHHPSPGLQQPLNLLAFVHNSQRTLKHDISMSCMSHPRSNFPMVFPHFSVAYRLIWRWSTLTLAHKAPAILACLQALKMQSSFTSCSVTLESYFLTFFVWLAFLYIIAVLLSETFLSIPITIFSPWLFFICTYTSLNLSNLSFMACHSQ